jgi:hypothetical protein
MSDKRRRFRAILKSLKEMYPREPQGNLVRHLTTLAALISGIVGSQRTNLPAIAKQVPDGTKRASRIKRYYRWIKNDRIDVETYFMPYAETLLISLSHRPLVLVIDGSDVGRGCLALVLGVVYKNRALPIAWLVVKGSQGHLPEELHVALVEHVQPMIPAGAQVILLGDGEFDGITLQATLDGFGWDYVCRTAKNVTLFEDGAPFTIEELDVRPGDPPRSVPEVLFTHARYGPVCAIARWRAGCKKPLYLITNMALVEETCYWYNKRFRIETFFSDQKSRGFHLHKSHLDDPLRLSRLMIAACLAYVWIIYLGASAHLEEWIGVIHRTDRCDLSLFRLGLDLLEHFLDEGMPIPVAFVALEFDPLY